jgi:hypothetical protein
MKKEKNKAIRHSRTTWLYSGCTTSIQHGILLLLLFVFFSFFVQAVQLFNRSYKSV